MEEKLRAFLQQYIGQGALKKTLCKRMMLKCLYTALVPMVRQKKLLIME